MNKIVLVTIFALLCQISHQNPTSTVKIAYDECGKINSCFGLPENCLGDRKCEVLLTTEPIDQEQVKFSLYWTRDSNSTDSYVAAGISTNGKMDGASVTLLTVGKDNKVNAQQGETFVGNFTGFKEFDVKGISMLTRKYQAGQVYGEWIRAQNTTVNKSTFDMKNTKYYILLAYGPVIDGKIKHHTKAWVSDSAVDLEDEPTIPANSTTAAPATTATGSAKTTAKTGTPPTPASSATPTGSPASTVTSTPGNSTATATTGSGNSTATGTPSNSTSSPQGTSTKGPSGSASALTMSLFLTIFVSILLFLN